VVVVRSRLPPDEDDLLPRPGPLRRVVRGEHDPADGRSGRGVQTGGNGVPGVFVLRFDDRLEELVQLARGEPVPDRGLFIDQPLLDHVLGDDPLGQGGALADPRLEQPQLAALDRELDVAHVAEVALEGLHVVLQLSPRVGHDIPELVEL
jgi:hypothetical protein